MNELKPKFFCSQCPQLVLHSARFKEYSFFSLFHSLDINQTDTRSTGLVDIKTERVCMCFLTTKCGILVFLGNNVQFLVWLNQRKQTKCFAAWVAKGGNIALENKRFTHAHYYKLNSEELLRQRPLFSFWGLYPLVIFFKAALEIIVVNIAFIVAKLGILCLGSKICVQ